MGLNDSGNESSEIVIEEKVRKKLANEFKMLESEASQGIKQREEAIKKRDEAIKRLKKEKDKIVKTMKDQEGNYGGMEAAQRKLKEQLEVIRSESKLGEEILVRQVNDLVKEREILRSKYDDETLMRKRLHNIIEDMKGKIRVFCRVRPMSNSEVQIGSLPVVTIVDQYTLKLRLKKELLQGQEGYKEEEYAFDACFGDRTGQEEVFEDTKMLMQSAIDGFNVCVFAYGQTGSGKTYTIQGTPDNPGIVPRALQELFLIKQRMEKTGAYSIVFECYMVELYLDQLHDLLRLPEKNDIHGKGVKLELREDPTTGLINVMNVSMHCIKSLEDANQVYKHGTLSRKTAKTSMNEDSSRSHFVFTLIVHTTNLNTNQKSSAKLSFVDLAGSEMVKKSNPSFAQLKETRAINKSLTALKDVISALSTGTANQYVPYRNNKLTHLMRDSIGGNSKTLMFVNISPADYNC